MPNDEWMTPPDILREVRYFFSERIDLDPASSKVANEHVRATRYLTKEDDGTSYSWFGNVFLNPPYSRGNIEKFTDHAIAQVNQNKDLVIIMLVNASTDASWFHKLIKRATCFCLTRGRIGFIDQSGIQQKNNSKGQAIFLLMGIDRCRFSYGDRFIAAFEESELGICADRFRV